MIRRLKTCMLIFVLFPLTAAAWEEGDKCPWMFTAAGGLNSDGYEFDFGITWYPVRNVGLKAALGFAGEIHEFSDWNWNWDDDYYDDYWYDYDDDYAVRFKFITSLDLQTPSILILREQGIAFNLFANPGISLSPGAEGSVDAQWFNWQFRGGIGMDIENVVVRMGYGCSDYDLYSGNPISHHYGVEEPYKITHTGFVSLGVRF